MSNSGEWGYKTVRVADGGLSSGDTSPMEDALNSLGGDGWGLVDTIVDSCGTGVNSGQMALVLKRPKCWDAGRHLTGARERPVSLVTHYEQSY